MKRNRIWRVLFMAYCAMMLWLLFDRSGSTDGVPYWVQVTQSINLVPFRTILTYTELLTSSREILVRLAVINLFGNVIMFIPLGFLLPQVFLKLSKLWRVLLTTALAIAAVEILQLFTLLGSCDIDDLILNLLGAAIGYRIYRMKKPAQ